MGPSKCTYLLIILTSHCYLIGHRALCPHCKGEGTEATTGIPEVSKLEGGICFFPLGFPVWVSQPSAHLVPRDNTGQIQSCKACHPPVNWALGTPHLSSRQSRSSSLDCQRGQAYEHLRAPLCQSWPWDGTTQWGDCLGDVPAFEWSDITNVGITGL